MALSMHNITGRNGYCGPSALSCVLGIPTDAVSKVVREVVRKNKTPVRGMGLADVSATLDHFGYVYDSTVFSKNRPTFSQWIEQYGDTDDFYLLATGNHWIVYNQGEVADSGAWFGRKPKPLPAKARRRTRAKYHIKVLSDSHVQHAVEKRKKRKRLGPPITETKDMAINEARRLIMRHGITVEDLFAIGFAPLLSTDV